MKSKSFDFIYALLPDIICLQEILTGIEKPVFAQFKTNPEEFIIKAASLINDEKATAIIQHITYDVMDDHYDTDIFTEPTIKGKQR